jgi:hypothetical protein
MLVGGLVGLTLQKGCDYGNNKMSNVFTKNRWFYKS